MKGQGYDKEPEVYEDKDHNNVQVIYEGVKLFDYNDFELALEFLKEDEETIENGQLVIAGYSRYCASAEDEKECYNFFNEKLAELYGEKTKLKIMRMEVEGWKKGDTCCSIIEIPGNVLVIIYGFSNYDELSENSVKEEEERIANNANKGL